MSGSHPWPPPRRAKKVSELPRADFEARSAEGTRYVPMSPEIERRRDEARDRERELVHWMKRAHEAEAALRDIYATDEGRMLFGGRIRTALSPTPEGNHP